MAQNRYLWKWIAFVVLLIAVVTFIVLKKPKHDVPVPFIGDSTLMDRLADGLILDLEYELDTQIESGLQGLRGIAIDSSDNMYLAGTNTLKVLRPDGTLMQEWPLSQPATCVALDDVGNIYVGYNSRIDVFTQEGKIHRSWGTDGNGPGELSVVTGIAIEGPYVFVADAGNRCVHRFDLTGDFVNDIGKPDKELGIDGIVCPSPWLDVDVDSEGYLFVTNPGRSRVERYKFDGTLVTQWGEPGMRTEQFFGCCNPTNLSILSEKHLVTAEKLVSRIKVYDIYGSLLANIASSFSEQKEMGLDIAVDSNHRVFVTNPSTGHVSVFAQKN